VAESAEAEAQVGRPFWARRAQLASFDIQTRPSYALTYAHHGPSR
jgi:hypothetical protein